MSLWPFKHQHAQAVDIEESKQRLAEAMSRRARTRRVSVGVTRAISGFTGRGSPWAGWSGAVRPQAHRSAVPTRIERRRTM